MSVGKSHETADFSDGVGFLVVEADGEDALFRIEQLAPTAGTATSTGSGEACLGSLADEITLELGECAENMEHYPISTESTSPCPQTRPGADKIDVDILMHFLYH